MSAEDEIPRKGDIIIYLDAETLPCEKDDPLWLKLSSGMKRLDGEDDEAFAQRKELVRQDMALTGPLGRAWMIGIAVGKDDPIVFSCDGKPESEKGLLENFYETVVKLAATTGEDGEEFVRAPWWVGHHIRGYDIPFLQQRALHHGLYKLARLLAPLKSKPWNRRILDTMELWPRTSGDRQAYRDWGIYGFGKLDTICAVLGIRQQTGVMGNSVYDCYLKGDREGVESHLIEDVDQVREVFKKLYPILI